MWPPARWATTQSCPHKDPNFAFKFCIPLYPESVSRRIRPWRPGTWGRGGWGQDSAADGEVAADAAVAISPPAEVFQVGGRQARAGVQADSKFGKVETLFISQGLLAEGKGPEGGMTP